MRNPLEPSHCCETNRINGEEIHLTGDIPDFTRDQRGLKSARWRSNRERRHFKWERPRFEAVGLSMRRPVSLRPRRKPVKPRPAAVEPRPAASNRGWWHQSDAIVGSTGVAVTFTSVAPCLSANRGFWGRNGSFLTIAVRIAPGTLQKTDGERRLDRKDPPSSRYDVGMLLMD